METWLQITIMIVAAILIVVSLKKVEKSDNDRVNFIWVLLFIISLCALLIISYFGMSEEQLNNVMNVESSMY